MPQAHALSAVRDSSKATQAAQTSKGKTLRRGEEVGDTEWFGDTVCRIRDGMLFFSQEMRLGLGLVRGSRAFFKDTPSAAITWCMR